jgi:hypothetical protein
MTRIGYGAYHSLTIGATIVMDLAIIPHVPTEVFLLFDGKILSSVNDACVVVMNPIIIPIFKVRISIGINFSSNWSLSS